MVGRLSNPSTSTFWAEMSIGVWVLVNEAASPLGRFPALVSAETMNSTTDRTIQPTSTQTTYLMARRIVQVRRPQRPRPRGRGPTKALRRRRASRREAISRSDSSARRPTSDSVSPRRRAPSPRGWER